MKAHHPADVQRRVRTEQEPGRVHQEQIGVAKPGGLYRPEDVGQVSPGDATEDVGCRQAGVIEKVGDVVVGNIEVAEAVKEICSTARSRPTRYVVLSLSLENCAARCWSLSGS